MVTEEEGMQFQRMIISAIRRKWFLIGRVAVTL